jgi:hypothetical protein
MARAAPKKRARRHPKVGRPCKLTPAVLRDLLDAFGVGTTVNDAAACAGIGARTLHEWLSRAAEKDAPAEFVQLAQKIEEARAKGRKKLLDKIAKSPDWRAAAHLAALGAREYSIRHQLEVSGGEGGPIPVQVYLPQLDPAPGTNGAHGPAEHAAEPDDDEG